MTEEEYIVATDLRTVRIAQDALRRMSSREERWRAIMITLQDWEDSLSAAVEKAMA